MDPKSLEYGKKYPNIVKYICFTVFDIGLTITIENVITYSFWIIKVDLKQININFLFVFDWNNKYFGRIIWHNDLLPNLIQQQWFVIWFLVVYIDLVDMIHWQNEQKNAIHPSSVNFNLQLSGEGINAFN